MPVHFTEGMEFHEQHHLEEHTGHEFHKTVIGDGSREFMPDPSSALMRFLKTKRTLYIHDIVPYITLS